MLIQFLSRHRTIFISIAIMLIVFVGLYFRFIYAFEVEFTNQYNRTEFTQDEYYYINMVNNLLSYQSYGYSQMYDAQVMPGYPIFLATLMVMFGTEGVGVLVVRVVQALISTGTIYLVYLLAAKVLSNRGAGLIAAALIAFYPPLILYSRFILPETLYIFFITLYFLIQIKAMEKEENPYHIGAGALLGISVLFKPMIFVLLPLPYIYMIIMSKNAEQRKIYIRNFVFYAIACCVVLVPWWVRNLITLERFVLLTDNFLETVTLFAFGKFGILLFEPAFYLPTGFTLLSGVSTPLHTYIVALGSLGLISGLFIKHLRLMSVFIGAYILLSLFFTPAPNYGLQYMPFLAIFAVYALFKIMSRTRIIVKREDNFINSDPTSEFAERISLE